MNFLKLKIRHAQNADRVQISRKNAFLTMFGPLQTIFRWAKKIRSAHFPQFSLVGCLILHHHHACQAQLNALLTDHGLAAARAACHTYFPTKDG